MVASIPMLLPRPTWFVFRAAVYLGVALAAATAFLAGAFLYAKLADAPAPANTELQSVPIPLPRIIPTAPRGEDNRSLLMSHFGAMRVSEVLGAPVYNAENVRVGSVNDFVMQADGNVSAVSVKRTSSGLVSSKGEKNTFVVPMGFIQWDHSGSGQWTAKLRTAPSPSEKTTGNGPN